MTTKIRRYGWYSIIGLSFVWLLHISWFRWGNIIVDTFGDQWLFYKLSDGKVLYKDLLYLYGFLPPYIVAFVYRLFGVNMAWSAYIGILVTASCAMALYRIGRLFFNRLIATMLVLHFLFLFAFANYGWVGIAAGICNFILPYSIASTFFIMFVLWSLYCFFKFILSDKTSYLRGWTIVLCCAFLSRIDYSCLLWSVCSVVGFFYLFIKRRVRDFGYFMLVPVAAAVLYALFVITNNAADGFNESTLRLFSFIGSGESNFAFAIAGFTNFFNNLRLVSVSFATHIIVLAFFYFLSAKIARLREMYPYRMIVLLTYLFTALCSFFVSYRVILFLKDTQYRLFPVMLILGMLVYLYELFACRGIHREKTIVLIAFFGVAFVLILRIMLKAGPFAYGFFLAVPSLVCYYIFCFELYPSLFKDVLCVGRNAKQYYIVCVIIFLIVSALPFVRLSLLSYRHRTFRLDFGHRGKMYCPPDRLTQRFFEVLTYLNNRVAPDETIVVLPEGIAINFMLLRDNPLRYYGLIPDEIHCIGEGNIIKQLKEHTVDYIVITHRPTFEYGYPFFGIHYGRKIARWILDHYSLEKVIGPFPFTSREFGVAIYKKRKNNGRGTASVLPK